MKTLFALILTTVSLAAQNFEVKFFSQVTNEMTLRGAPTNGIAVVRPIGTNTSPHIGWTYVGTAADLRILDGLNKPMMDGWLKTNWFPYLEAQKIAAVQQARTNKVALANFFDNCRDYEELCRTNTPTAAQLALQVRRMNAAWLKLEALSQR